MLLTVRAGKIDAMQPTSQHFAAAQAGDVRGKNHDLCQHQPNPAEEAASWGLLAGMACT